MNSTPTRALALGAMLTTLVGGCAFPDKGYQNTTSVVTFTKNLRIDTQPGPESGLAAIANRTNQPETHDGYQVYKDSWCAHETIEAGNSWSGMALTQRRFQSYCTRRKGRWVSDGPPGQAGACISTANPKVVYFHAAFAVDAGCLSKVEVLEPTGDPFNINYLRVLAGFGVVNYADPPSATAAFPSPSTLAAPAGTLSADGVIVFTQEGIARQNMLPRFGLTYEESGRYPFASQDKMLQTVKQRAFNDGMTGIMVLQNGKRIDNYGRIDEDEWVVKAVGVRLLEPTSENVVSSLGRAPLVVGLEFDRAVRFALERNYREAAPVLMRLLKGPSATYGGPRAVAAYARLAERGGIPDLEKLLKFGADLQIRIAAGHELLALGDRRFVEDVVATDRSDTVAEALRRELVR